MSFAVDLAKQKEVNERRRRKAIVRVYLELDVDLIIGDTYWHSGPQPSHLRLSILRKSDMFVCVLDQRGAGGREDHEMSIWHRLCRRYLGMELTMMASPPKSHLIPPNRSPSACLPQAGVSQIGLTIDSR